MRTNGRTDMTKLIVGFRNFANAPENWTKKVTNRADSEKSIKETKFRIRL